MNKKGQALVLFVLFIPIFILVFAMIFDSALIVSEEVKLKNIGKDAITNLVEKRISTYITNEIVIKNDKDIEIIDISHNSIHLKRIIKSYFGKMVGHDTYELEVNYYGYMKNDKLIIEEKGN